MRISIGLLSLLFLATPALAAPAETIGWRDLSPRAAQSGDRDAGRSLAERLGGQAVEIAGYALPSDVDGDLVHEFLLVPTIGGCSHTRQPPPNQMVRVRPQEPLRLSRSYQPVSVAGTLRTALLTQQFFFRDGILTVESGYGIGGAAVRSAPPSAIERGLPGPEAGPNPWKFLAK